MNTKLTVEIPEKTLCPGCNDRLTERNIVFVLGFAWCGFCARARPNHNLDAPSWSLCFNLGLIARHTTNIRGITLFTPSIRPPEPLLMLPDDELLHYLAPGPYDAPTFTQPPP